ncbi:hypothetical protein KVR01_005941 [Diaporthe batatas]|uniref:uncharacterized protein n=1 Tax=Diaporthe batatas TaxID=748121 RepID=UPI001D045E5C|nr:uncharacterized protein KVR01_005941 [Diaporthe batatas]KAG8164023.1 hypothetical protein KVR01_005941 [Diaporthe batatas]
MEPPAAQTPRRDRRRPSFHSPNSSRTVSRSSTRPPSARMPSHNMSDSASNITPSPGQRYAQPVGSRFPQRRGSMGSNVDRPPTPVSKGSIRGSQSSTHQEPASALLQEKLQHQRRSEIQRNLNRLADEMGTADNAQPAASTPVRCATADGKRPASSEASDDVGKNRGPALKEMEKAMSNLHKINFDLKLELFHRRERQAVLDKQVEVLEAEKSRLQDSNDGLMLEIEKRDKAVEEAVHMIVGFEARIELLLREREMLKQLEADKALFSKLTAAQSISGLDGAGTTNTLDAVSTDHRKGLARMPSFLSERTDNTENLRNVYLGAQGSLLSLSKTDPRADHVGTGSPNMSVLSESSFRSIYGTQPAPRDHSPPQAEVESQLDDPAGRGVGRSLSMSMHDVTPTRPSAKEAIEKGETTSPLRRLERLDSSPVIQESSETTPLGRDIDRPATSIKLAKPQPLLRVRKPREKPAPTRRVITDIPATRVHALPPTPDTMSSSMNQSLCSDDTTRHGRDDREATYPVTSRATLDQTDEIEPGHWRFKGGGAAQPPSVTAFTGRKDYLSTNYPDISLGLPRRPRSADETTISRHKLDWDSGSEFDDAASEVSSFDHFMREGLRPSHAGQPHMLNRAAASHRYASGGAPDLFGFPSDSKGWQSNHMFGALNGNGYYGTAAPLASALDNMGASLPAPEIGTYGSGLAGASSPRPTGNGVAPPPAPNRKSSLRARTSAPGTPMTTRPPRPFGRHGETDSSRKSSLTGHTQTASNSRSITPTPPDRPPAQSQEDASATKRHYPPTASQQQQAASRPRSRGITSLFRRSLGSSHPQPSASVPNNQSPFPPPAKAEPPPAPVGVPAWEWRNERGDEEMSATPPPIMRKRAPVHDVGFGDNTEAQGATGPARAAKPHPLRSSSPGLGAGLSNVLATHDGGAPLTSNSGHDQEGAPTSASTSGHGSGHGHGHGHGHGRKWFGLRATSSKHSGT